MVNDTYNYIGQRIKELRRLKKMTQIELSEKTGIKQSRLSNYEKGLTLPRFGNLEKIANALGVEYSDILNFEISKNEMKRYLKYGFDPQIYDFIVDNSTTIPFDGFEESDLKFYEELKKNEELKKENEVVLSDVINGLYRLNDFGLNKVYEYIQDLVCNKKNLKN